MCLFLAPLRTTFAIKLPHRLRSFQTYCTICVHRGEDMKSMDKLTTGIAYGTSAGNAGFWALQLLDKVTPSQWAAIGVLGSLVFGLLTYLTNLYFKIKEDKRKVARGE